NGPDSFTFSASDATLSSPQRTFSLTVVPVNDAPVAVADTATVAEDGSVTINVTANDTDVAGDALSVTRIVSGPPHGTALLRGTQTVTSRAPNSRGGDSFVYAASDGHGGNSSATVSITVTAVNDAPVATDDTFSVGEDGVFTAVAPGLLGNDTDADG